MADKLVVALIVGAAFAFAFRSFWKMFKGKESGCTGCSCSSSCSSSGGDMDCHDLISK